MRPRFISNELQRKFEVDGFIKIQLLSSEEVQKLANAYKSVKEEHEKINIPYITTSHSNNAELITRVDGILQEIMAPAINKYMDNYKLLFGNYLVKMPLKNSDTEPHQDITFVDESRFTSVNVWVALQDINKENGCMYFLKGSHNLISTLRPTHNYPWAYEFVKNEIKNNSESFTAKAGEAFIFNHAVVHGSFANKTSEPRLAAVIAAYHGDADLLHYYLPEGEKSKVKKFSMTKEAFLYFVKNMPPQKGLFIEDIDFDFKQLSSNEFRSLRKKNTYSFSVFSRVKKLLNG